MERCCHKSVLRSEIRNLQAFKFLSKSLRYKSAEENQTGEQYSKQDKIKELEHYSTTPAIKAKEKKESVQNR